MHNFIILYLIIYKNNMSEGEQISKICRKKPKTMAKHIKQYQFSALSAPQHHNKPTEHEQVSIEEPKQQKQKLLSDIYEDSADDEQSNGLYTIKHGESQFEDHLMGELNELLTKWQKDMGIIKGDLERFEHVVETESEIRAFDQCMILVENQFSQLAAMHRAAGNVVLKKILQVEDYKRRVIKEINELKCDNERLIKQNEILEEEHKKKIKQQTDKKNVMDKIMEQNAKITEITNGLLLCKQKSYEQKNEFIEIQSEEFKLESKIGELEMDQKKCQQNQVLVQKYDQLLKIKEKVICNIDCAEEEIRPHLERKIEKMSKLRSELMHIDETMKQCCAKIGDQNIVVDALKQKLYHQEKYMKEEKTEDFYNLFRNRYNRLYFGEKASQNEQWNTYNSYLRQLINRNKNIGSSIYNTPGKKNSLTQQLKIDASTTTNQNFDRLQRDKKKNEYNGNNINGSSSNIFDSGINTGGDKMISKKDTGTKLPRIKIEGKVSSEEELKNKIKEQYQRQKSKSLLQNKQLSKTSSGQSAIENKNITIQNFLNQASNSSNQLKQSEVIVPKKKPQQISVSVDSSNSSVSGQFIPVEFEKR